MGEGWGGRRESQIGLNREWMEEGRGEEGKEECEIDLFNYLTCFMFPALIIE